MRSEQYYKEQSECHFRPHLIAKKTNRLANERRLYDHAGAEDHSRFSELYEDAKKRKERQAKLAEAILDNHCTFKPDTSRTKHKNEQLAQETPAKNYFNNPGQQAYHARIKSQGQGKDALVDPQTGQPLFHPRIGRPPKNLAQVPVSDKLYRQGLASKERL